MKRKREHSLDVIDSPAFEHEIRASQRFTATVRADYLLEFAYTSKALHGLLNKTYSGTMTRDDAMLRWEAANSQLAGAMELTETD